ncbi:DegT/DnrJ/EryC1/StrS family aminotransferase [Candidatus Magnetominusculus xianensis]|uniref:UDP-4-amino-4-deoxy-L-arabinose--oxoglutarate aminotransferase n=1 Tax=Candidatus Magnetominusculus xianensis TaxID=1748249 RepID=A0ABR5SF11_9BACT|nr:DegT/DnrJ/EryC1/StrS family aminotransferase [Candidatus Magnetominusculus xianensis]KWT85313.1 UDP-4-amino-4-deoxy-L-arabinose--oxoglutarate aminotransferase [Candidatus Magnetominusculus xianensis]MBF0404824.1 DegT/DnrJ/EryC1/StrS family aminotransferase [Nitrospirota bacterium]
MKIDFYKHNIESSDIDTADEVLKSLFLTTGQKVSEFETKFSQYLGTSHTIGVMSCTAALHLCLVAWGIGEGDEVITTPMSFCATANAILYVNAVPVFVDVEEGTGNINAELIESKITKKTKAIMPVHLYGQMCDMRKIRDIANRHGLIVIEDCAHCVEGQRDGVKVGELGDAACFSFYTIKNITSGEGGAITTNNDEKARLLYMLRLHGIDKSAAERYTKKYAHWDMTMLGWKCNMDNIRAALLIGQLERIEKLWAKRDEKAKKYTEAFKDLSGVRLTAEVPNSKHAHHIFTIGVANRDEMLTELQDAGIGVAVNYRPIHLLDYYRRRFGYKEGDFPVAEQIGSATITLPLYPKLMDEEQDYIINTVRSIITKRGSGQ